MQTYYIETHLHRSFLWGRKLP